MVAKPRYTIANAYVYNEEQKNINMPQKRLIRVYIDKKRVENDLKSHFFS